MIPELRREFNRRWKPELYSQLLRRLSEAGGIDVPFRCSETPVFLPSSLLEKMVRYGQELYQQLAGNREYLAASESAIPNEYRVPNEPEHPLFLQADFGITRTEDGTLEPKLVEIQGFPSIYGFQAAMATAYREVYDLPSLDPKLSWLLDGLDHAHYEMLLRDAILNGHAPEEVVLLEIEPYEQKTLPDFVATQKITGIKIADIRELERRGTKLYLHNVPIKRIYNRVIVDELVRKRIEANFNFTDELDVEWAGHPNWFFRISKFSLPWFRHPSIPDTWFLSDLGEPPADLQNYVLKPLYSFAGLGVKIAPSKEEIEAIAPAQRQDFILQRKMDFIPTIDTPSGPTKVEVRIMYIWTGNRMQPVLPLLRTGRGKMMGVDFNKNLDWVGASAGFFDRGPAK
jgi:hypothetical protein